MAMYPCLFGGGSGPAPVLITKNITANGTYNASADNADGYSQVKVEVSGGGSTLGEKTISTYGVYNASDDSLDGYSKVTNVTGLETATASGAVASISDAVEMPCPSVVAQIVPTQSGSGTPSPDNVRTLSGSSSVNLKQTGKNLLALPVVRFNEASADKTNCFWINSGVYELSFSCSEAHKIAVRMIDRDNNVITDNAHRPNSVFSWNNAANAYYTTTDRSAGTDTVKLTIVDSCYIRVMSNLTDGGFTNTQLEVGETATTYEAYSGTTYTASLGRTVYGGSHDFVSGQGTITFVKDVFRWGDGLASTDLGTHTRRRFDLSVKADNTASPTKSLCSIATWNASSSLDDVHYNIYSPDANTNRFICFLPNNISEDTMIEVCYPIETPTTYSITGQTITTAQGTNNFYSDTGDTAATYYREKTGDSYLYNVNTVIFNTGYVHKANTKLVLDCEPWQSGNAYAVLCGARAGSYANNAMLFFGKFNGYRYGWSRTGQEEVSDYWDNLSGNYAWYNTRCIITMDGNTCTVLNVVTGETRTITCANATVNDGIAPVALFCDNNSSSADGFTAQDWATMKFYSLKIYESDVLVHNFVPAYNNNQYCIYDTVDQVYKYDLQASGAYLNGYVK